MIVSELHRTLSAEPWGSAIVDAPREVIEEALAAELSKFAPQDLLHYGIHSVELKFVYEVLSRLFEHAPRITGVQLLEATFSVASGGEKKYVCRLRDFDPATNHILLELYPHARVAARLKLALSPAGAYVSSRYQLEDALKAITIAFPPTQTSNTQTPREILRFNERNSVIQQALAAVPHASAEDILLVAVHGAHVSMRKNRPSAYVSKNTVFRFLTLTHARLFPTRAGFEKAIEAVRNNGLLLESTKKFKGTHYGVCLSESGAAHVAALIG